MEALFLKTFDLVGRERGAAKGFAVFFAGGDDFGDGGVELGMVLAATQAKGKGEVASADKEHVNAGGGGNFFNVGQGGGVLDDGDDEDILIGKIIVALASGPSGLGEVGARTAPADGRSLALARC